MRRRRRLVQVVQLDPYSFSKPNFLLKVNPRHTEWLPNKKLQQKKKVPMRDRRVARRAPTARRAPALDSSLSLTPPLPTLLEVVM